MIVIHRGESPGLIAYANPTADVVAVPPRQSAIAPIALSTEDIRYGGCRTDADSQSQLFPYELLVTGPSERRL